MRFSLDLGESLAKALRENMMQPLESVLPAILQVFTLCLQDMPSKTRCITSEVVKSVLSNHCGKDGALRARVEEIFGTGGAHPIDFLTYWHLMEKFFRIGGGGSSYYGIHYNHPQEARTDLHLFSTLKNKILSAVSPERTIQVATLHRLLLEVRLLYTTS